MSRDLLNSTISMTLLKIAGWLRNRSGAFFQDPKQEPELSEPSSGTKTETMLSP